jgi:hypothetical protein
MEVKSYDPFISKNPTIQRWSKSAEIKTYYRIGMVLQNKIDNIH